MLSKGGGFVGEFIKEVPKEQLKTNESSIKVLYDFLRDLFNQLGYDMEIEFKDDHGKNIRTIRARWTDKN